MKLTVFSQILKDILLQELWDKGIDSPYPLERVWKYKEALEVCDILSKNNWYILGADLYEDVGPYVRTNGDGPYKQSTKECIQQSAWEYNEYVKEYLNMYHQRNGNDFWYAFVFCDYKELVHYFNNPAEPNKDN